MEEQFTFKRNHRIFLIAVMAGALLTALLSVIISGIGTSRVWANILLNNQFFLGLSLGAAFFIAVVRVSLAGWHTIIQRLPEAMTAFLPVAFILMLILYFGIDNIYHWAHHEDFDPVIEGKEKWLNIPFFFIRMIFYFTGWIALTWAMKKNTDSLMTSADIKYFNKRKIFAGIYLVFFGITVSTSSWDWIMSIEEHWYSTIFGWYVMISMFVASLAFLILFIWFLKGRGYLKELRDDHIHDLALLLFAFSIFWTYEWYSEFFLIWYGHLPEETAYFVPRLNEFRTVFFLNLGINFLVPFFGLIRLRSKRNANWVAIIAAIVLIGHWIDYWLMIMPGTVGSESGIGVFEVSVTMLYAALFIFISFRALAQGQLVVKNDPFLKESLSYES